MLLAGGGQEMILESPVATMIAVPIIDLTATPLPINAIWEPNYGLLIAFLVLVAFILYIEIHRVNTQYFEKK